MPPSPTKNVGNLDDSIPIIDSLESFPEVVSKVSLYIIKAVDTAYTWEQLRSSVAGYSLRPLILYLSEDCHHPAIVAALLAARYSFDAEEDDGTGLGDSRALACEFVAWQFLTFLSEKELIEYLLHELPDAERTMNGSGTPAESNENGFGNSSHEAFGETSPLLQGQPNQNDGLGPPARASLRNGLTDTPVEAPESDEDLGDVFSGMNALEIAAVSNAKKFISQKPVQSLVQDIWEGEVIFWENMSVRAVKKPRAYNRRVADPFTRLRVPKYQKTFQVMFFISLLALYYTVLVQRNPQGITISEALLYVWLLAFAYDEFGEIQDSGILFYRVDFWSLWDLGIILVGAAFFVTRVIGLFKDSDYLVDISFDILSMVALFLVPRIFSIFSLNPYFGSLIPVLKEMTKTFCKFLPVIIVLYLGFLTTFTMLARDRLTLNEMSWLLVKVFFGSSYLGFDVAVTISPLFGYTLMLIFVCLTNILLLTSLVSLVSNSLTEVMAHAREEYLFQYSIYVLESSTSRRLTYFMPPLNLVPLLLLRPLRLFLPSQDVRRIRIYVLKATHMPFVALIWAYERFSRLIYRHASPLAKAPRSMVRPTSSTSRTSPQGTDHTSRRTRSALVESNPVTASTTTESALGKMATSDLVNLVQDLALKVDNLTSMVAGQQKD